MLTLIVKGNESEARKACEYNGITVTSAKEHERFNETIVRTDDKFEHDAQKWFITSCRDDERKPTPIGTLLWYGEAWISTGIFKSSTEVSDYQYDGTQFEASY